MKNIINFDQIDQYGPQEYRDIYDVVPEYLDRVEVGETAKVTIEARVDKGDLPGEYLIEGSSDFTAALNCSRCAEPYPFANSSTFHVRFRPRPETSAEENEEVEIAGEEELDVEFYAERQIPLRDLAIEQVQLSIPMKPLCEDKCLGLCPHCGANRNREGCSCQTAETDVRWGALHEIRDQLARKKEN